MSKHGKLEKNLEPQAEGGKGLCLTSPSSSRCLLSLKSGPALRYLVVVNCCFPLFLHWVRHLYLSSQGWGGRACSFATSCTTQPSALIPFHRCPSQRLTVPGRQPVPVKSRKCWGQLHLDLNCDWHLVQDLRQVLNFFECQFSYALSIIVLLLQRLTSHSPNLPLLPPGHTAGLQFRHGHTTELY